MIDISCQHPVKSGLAEIRAEAEMRHQKYMTIVGQLPLRPHNIRHVLLIDVIVTVMYHASIFRTSIIHIFSSPLGFSTKPQPPTLRLETFALDSSVHLSLHLLPLLRDCVITSLHILVFNPFICC